MKRPRSRSPAGLLSRKPSSSIGWTTPLSAANNYATYVSARFGLQSACYLRPKSPAGLLANPIGERELHRFVHRRMRGNRIRSLTGMSPGCRARWTSEKPAGAPVQTEQWPVFTALQRLGTRRPSRVRALRVRLASLFELVGHCPRRSKAPCGKTTAVCGQFSPSDPT